MHRLRVYHASLAILVVLAFASGDAGQVHAWLGYGVAGVIALRLVLALTGQPVLGLARFYPAFDNLRLGTALTHPAISRTLLAAIALCTIAVVATGIVMDRGQALDLGMVATSSAPQTIVTVINGEERGELGEGHARVGERGEPQGEIEDNPLGEGHEFFAKLLIGLVAAHVSYLLLFKRPLAQFMLFLPLDRKP